MGIAASSRHGSAGWLRTFGAVSLACLFGFALPVRSAQAQAGLETPAIPSGSQMLLEADTLIYDNNDQTVTAAGGVRIDYGGNRLVAERVIYDRQTRRLIARGQVQVVDSTGTKVFSDEIDISDDFADGFVNSLRVETVDKTYFAAESADRRAGFLTTFNNGVYTACEPCEDKPDKAPIWRVKAKRIIWNTKTKIIRFERPRFEIFGTRVAGLPSFEIADPSVKRKSGFLIPSIIAKSKLGYGVAIPYYFALAPTYDLTVIATPLTKQGFLGQAEFRQRFNNGEYSVRIAGISQAKPDAFDANTVDSGPPGDENKLRGMMGTKGRFAINPRWDFGWDILAQSDKNFSTTYAIQGYQDYIHHSQVYLTGLDDRNFFDLRAFHFEVQESALDSNPSSRNDKQPIVLPSFDYSFTPDEPVLGGELNFDLNSRVILRDNLDRTPANPALFPVERVRGIDGDSERLTAAAEWKRTFITDGGLVVTPLLAFQADTTHVGASDASIAALNSMASNPVINASTDLRSSYNRFMPTAGLEMRFPLLFASANSSHVLEPTAQLFARPDEGYVDTLDIPNEDAQSFVFDATTLFERDKFSGYDRIEGGSRANIGLRYSGDFGGGWTANGLVGQSYQVGGENSFDAPDLVNAGAFSGLESASSDFVGLLGLATPTGISASVSARLDEQTLEMRRGEVKAGYSNATFSINAKYAFIQAQPLYGFAEDRQEITLGASTRFAENWRLFGSGTYDFERSLAIQDAVGIAYDDECFSYLMSISESRDRNTREVSRSFGFTVSFRTIGDFGSGAVGSGI